MTVEDKKLVPTGDAIRARRTELEMSQQDLANEIGVSIGAVRKWEGGAKPIRALGKLIVEWYYGG